jgi:urease accessory protein
MINAEFSSASASKFTLMQLSDSFFPSGSFTLSHGLESLVQAKQIRSPQDFQQFLRSLLLHRIGPSDAIALVHAHRASQQNHWSEICRIDHLLFAQTPLSEIRESQRKSGRALLMVARSIWNSVSLENLHQAIEADDTPGLHPIVFALVGQAAQLTETDTVFAFLHSFTAGLLGAGIRLGVLGHVTAQQTLVSVIPDLETVAQDAISASLDELWSCTPYIDIAQMSHRHSSQRLFTT